MGQGWHNNFFVNLAPKANFSVAPINIYLNSLIVLLQWIMCLPFYPRMIILKCYVRTFVITESDVSSLFYQLFKSHYTNHLFENTFYNSHPFHYWIQIFLFQPKPRIEFSREPSETDATFIIQLKTHPEKPPQFIRLNSK